MSVNVLAIGDVVGEGGVDILRRKLWSFRKLKGISFTVVNGENADVVGITPPEAKELLASGADVVTLGNHSFQRNNIIRYLDDATNVLRPSNLSPLSPGMGWGVFDTMAGKIAVISLIGRCGMDFGPDSPFYEAERILKKLTAKMVLIDFHAEATSEKAALAWYLDGRISALWGTHTHVQTSDARVLPKGTGFITDLGMTGAVDSILGVRPDQSIARFLGDPRRVPYSQAPGKCKIEGAIFELDPSSGRCLSVEAVRITE